MPNKCNLYCIYFFIIFTEKKARTQITSEQQIHLNSVFEITKFPPRRRIVKLSSEVNLEFQVIKVSLILIL